MPKSKCGVKNSVLFSQDNKETFRGSNNMRIEF